MYIVYKENEIKQLQLKYLLLEMDTIKLSNEKTVTAQCVIDRDHITLEEISSINVKQMLHKKLLEDYKLQNWIACKNSISMLKGSFGGELDSYYDVLNDRISNLNNTYDKNWSSIIDVSATETN